MEEARAPYNRAAVIAAALAGLLFGFDTAVIAGTTGALRDAFALSPSGLGAVVSAALWGTLVGALGAGIPGDRFGSRAVLGWIALLYVLSAAGSALSWNLESLFFFRFLGGLAIGGSSVLAPVYIAEISPAARRGALVGLFQLNIVIGILAAYLSNFLVAQALADADAWRMKFAVAAVPSLILLLALLRIPQSPRWLLERGRRAEALAAIERLQMGAPDTIAAELESARPETATRLTWSAYRKPILLALTIAAFNQLSGINAILYYLNDIFRAAGFSALSADVQAVAIGIANLAATMVGLSLIDRVGRKPLLMTGAAGTCAALAGVAAIYASGRGEILLLPMLVLFILFFALSQGAVIWVYLSEIFPTPVRARGQALGSATHWVMNAIISFAFPVIAAHTLALPFWVFAAAMALQFVVVWRFFPETRSVTLESMNSVMGKPDADLR
ncbi:sugar porter family MFS transporter [Sphingosinicella sp. BN140058]|uniref:sugar porter family MFS transporter n=1 Tax=Sphingosinicella sp. BN140058 TaxID=1892855 RepID=UPI001012FFEA|nr:sugar porter family MFS transporter [Sphingosinicella sp. BN140058]QAY76641.1 MFS transporter [Sphingosinicella sp. BN140058]